jgi:clathrin heavy chain
MVYALAKMKSTDLEFFIKQPHSANLQHVGDQCYNEKMYDAARVIFEHIKKWPSLVSCLIKLKNFSSAVEYARNANLISTWKELYKACINNDPPEFRYAQFSALNIINNPGPDLEELVEYYEV